MALFVVIHHVYLTIEPNPGSPSRLPPALGSLALGHFAVTVFIVISGWSLALHVRSHRGHLAGGARPFFMRRFWRIVPTFWVALGASTALTLLFLDRRTGTHWDTVLPFSWGATGSAALLLGDVLPRRGVPNHAYWSIPVEAHIYLLFPLLIVAARRWKPMLVGLTSIAVSFLGLLALVLLGRTNAGSMMPVFYGCFAVAALVSLRSREPSGRQVWALRTAIVVVVAGLLGVSATMGPQALLDRAPFIDLPVALAATATLSLAARQESRLRRALSTRVLVTIGAMAYSLYLIHAPIVQWVWQVVVRPRGLGAPGQFVLLLVVGTVASVLSAGMLFLAVERHFLAGRPRPALLADRDPAASALVESGDPGAGVRPSPALDVGTSVRGDPGS